MCDRDASRIEAAGLPASISDAFPGGRRSPDVPNQDVRGSRRYRLWDLPSQTHCPLIGVCLPMPVLRRLVSKALGNTPVADDYEFHVAAVAECGRRMPIAEALQRELDRRYAPALRRFAQAKTTESLAVFWNEALQQGDGVAEALWATLSHPRCDEDLREKVCRDIHMFQHQMGACNRADLQRLEQLKEENAALRRELAEQKERHAQAALGRATEMNRMNADLMRARGQLVARDSELASLQEQLASLHAAVPGLQARLELLRHMETLQQRTRDLERERTAWQQRAEQEMTRLRKLEEQVATLRTREEQRKAGGDARQAGELADLRDKAVLCVGGRTASVPVYRQLIECTGGRFLHHDGGEEDNPAQLEASLAAADLVICQTGCISHDAYWRVKDHCKRSGKRCVFVDKPSASSLERSLRGLEQGDNAPQSGILDREGAAP
ncbi:MAG TPA: DUF2325 domain-containing protein [Noviherbaspirillum sp.]|nr:DUF2325 domain-containing protein [Noviherbaspirillum sp.]